MNSEINIEEIRNYLEGKLTSDELAGFDASLQSNADLASEVEMQREIRKTVRVSGMKSDLEVAHTDWVRSQGSEIKQLVSPKREGSHFWKIAIAASFIFAIALFALWKVQPPIPEQALAMEYLITDPGLPTLMSANSNKIDDAMIDYKMGNFNVATHKFKTLAPSDTVNYYLANSLIGEKKYNNALEILAKIPPSSTYFPHVQWYTGLIKLYGGQADNPELKSILDDTTHPDHTNAVDLFAKRNHVTPQ